jgi:hypothetical protein
VDEIGWAAVAEVVTSPFEVTDGFSVWEFLAAKDQDDVPFFVSDRQGVRERVLPRCPSDVHAS